MDAVDNIFLDFNNLIKNAETFLNKEGHNYNNTKSLLKRIYDFTKQQEVRRSQTNTLPELIIENFDIEQIWQQIELQNEEILNDRNVVEISKYVSNKDKLLFNEATSQDSGKTEMNLGMYQEPENTEHLSEQDDNLTYETDDSVTSNENNSSDGEHSEVEEEEKTKRKHSVVDDDFFNLKEMENFLNKEEKTVNQRRPSIENEDSSDESIDLFKSNNSEDEEESQLKNPRFKDFFKKQNVEDKRKNRNKLLEELDKIENEENNMNKEQKSDFEIREERLKEKIQEIEKNALSEKPWPMKGELTADKRPQNSLLEEILEFDLVSRPAPIITEETTHILEDVILQRIKDKSFDDVERKKRLVNTPLEYKKKLVLDQEKSKESLAQIYEREYLQQKESLHSDSVQKEESELHKEIRKMVHNLFTRLDALSNFHFSPKPPAPELKVVTNLPAISIEEVAPVAASDATLLAPEEIKSKIRGEIIGKEERTDTDKKRERRKKKLKQKVHAKEKAKREHTKKELGKSLKVPKGISKEKNVKKMDESAGSKAVKSSRAFFEQLQEQVSSHIKSKQNKNKSKEKIPVDAKKIKL